MGTAFERVSRIGTARAWLLVAAVLAGGVGLAGCGDSGDSGKRAAGSPTVAPTTVAPDGTVLVPAQNRTKTRLRIPGGPDWMAADEKFLYLKRDDGGVDRIDPGTDKVVASVEVEGDLCQGIGVGFGAAWVCQGADVARVDLDAMKVVATVKVGKAAEQGHLATGFDRVWVLVGDGSTLVSINPATNAVEAPIVLGARGTDLAVGQNGVWVVSGLDDAVLRVDPAARKVVSRTGGIDEPRTVAVSDAVWVGAFTSTARLDPATGRVIATVPVGTGREGGISATEDQVWVRSKDQFLRHVDPATNKVTEGLSADVTSSGDVLVAFGSVWTSAYDDATLFRLTPR